MDLPDEELKQPLVNGESEELHVTPGPPPSNQDRRPLNQLEIKNLAPSMVNNPSTPPKVYGGPPPSSRGPMNAGEEEEKHQDLPYAAPNVHPYAVPEYDSNPSYGNSGWAFEKMSDGPKGINIDIVFSGMYTFAAALTIIQGFAMMVHFSWASISLGLYTMAFGVSVVLYDLRAVVFGVSIEAYFPFLGRYGGRALTVLFFAVLCGQIYEYAGWTKFIVLFNLLVATLQFFVWFTTKTITAEEPPHLEDLPDI